MYSTLQQFLDLDWKQLEQECKELQEKHSKSSIAIDQKYQQVLDKVFPDTSTWQKSLSSKLIDTPVAKAYISYSPLSTFARQQNKLNGEIRLEEPGVVRTFHFSFALENPSHQKEITEKDLCWERYHVLTAKSSRGYYKAPKNQIDKVSKNYLHLLVGMVNLFLEEHPGIFEIEATHREKLQFQKNKDQEWAPLRTITKIKQLSNCSQKELQSLIDNLIP